MALITDPAHYDKLGDIPLEYDVRVEEVAARYVQQGDILANHTVGEVKRGTKWADISDTEGKRILRVPLSDLVSVERQYPTEESVNARGRAHRNERIARALATRTDQIQEALDKLNKHYAEYGYLRHWEVEPLIAAAAEEKVWRRFVSAVSHYEEQEDFEGDLVDVVEEFKEHLKEGLTGEYRHRALSRSTSIVSNLMDDCDTAAEAAFVNKHWLW